MEISSLTGTNSTADANRFASLSSEEFIRVLTTELKNQDPFQPNDSAALLEQLSSIRNIESQSVLQEKIESLVLQNQIASASGMIGKVVQGLTDDSRNVVGVVDTVQVAGDRVVLSLHNGERLAMTRVNAIAEGGVSSDAPGNATLSADLNGDGEVDVADLGIFAAQYVS